jgi:hypothetical protein
LISPASVFHDLGWLEVAAIRCISALHRSDAGAQPSAHGPGAAGSRAGDGMMIDRLPGEAIDIFVQAVEGYPRFCSRPESPDGRQ